MVGHCFFFRKYVYLLTLPVPIPDEQRKVIKIFIFIFIFIFMKTFKAFGNFCMESVISKNYLKARGSEEKIF